MTRKEVQRRGGGKAAAKAKKEVGDEPAVAVTTTTDAEEKPEETLEEKLKMEVVGFAWYSRLVIGVACLLCGYIGTDYDLSTLLVPIDNTRGHPECKGILSGLARPLVRWDAIYFLDIAQNGYSLEQQFAFFPGFPLLVRAVRSIFDPFGVLCMKDTLILAAIFVSNIAFMEAAGSLYELAIAHSFRPKTAKIAAILFCLSPASIILSSFYSESLFALLTFKGMTFHATGKKWNAAICWALASCVRANGFVYAGFFFYNILEEHVDNYLQNDIMPVIKNLGLALFVVAPFFLFQLFGYWTFCWTSAANEVLRPWCTSSRFPMIYAFVQEKYWNVGFLKYWTFQQLPNFLLAGPVLLVNLLAVLTYYVSDPQRFTSLGLQKSHFPQNLLSEFTVSSLLPHIYLTVVLMANFILVAHIQVAIRFFATLPLAYLYAASLINTKNGSIAGNWYMFYSISYASIGVVLFAAFLPPA